METTIGWTATALPNGEVLPGFTWNLWWGCQIIGPGCHNCYAETLAKRFGHNVWGRPDATPRYFPKAAFQNIENWDKRAKALGHRQKVFCMSMGDFLEAHPAVIWQRHEACKIMERLEWLDILLLTKRPENARKFLPASWFNGHWPAHVWFGVTTENQRMYDIRIGDLAEIPAPVRFLSIEPMLTPVKLRRPDVTNWVICGGESGHNSRPMQEEWATDLRQQCAEHGIPFFMKQMGTVWARKNGKAGKADDIRHFPEALQAQEFPTQKVCA